jgi:protein tyrosine phosphatase (PTP) superfamily phosphohydrolase (DUF442 family)
MPDSAAPVEPTATCDTTAAPASRRPVKPALLTGLALACFVMFAAECLRIFVGSNLHAVVPGKCYRSAQPTPDLLENLQRTHGIRSVVNLRDENNDQVWYQQEKQAIERMDLKLFNAGLCSKEQVPVHDFCRFIQAMKDAPEPILIHCANGNDRTGLASAVYLLLRTDAPLSQARGQLSIRYGHFSWTKASCLSRILDNYENWLAQEKKAHHPDHFYHWGMHHYRQEVCD